ncbi:hypothetical protein SOPP22_01630 [Shewanella sp. OPT22]|nr:hypothetical protein SOPP22_01630 [Shewanella sp. OPT22]
MPIYDNDNNVLIDPNISIGKAKFLSSTREAINIFGSPNAVSFDDVLSLIKLEYDEGFNAYFYPSGGLVSVCFFPEFSSSIVINRIRLTWNQKIISKLSELDSEIRIDEYGYMCIPNLGLTLCRNNSGSIEWYSVNRFIFHKNEWENMCIWEKSAGLPKMI